MEDEVLDALVTHWQKNVDSGNYNGMPLCGFHTDSSNPEFQQAIISLIRKEKICTPALDAVNKHINRYGFGKIEQQVESLNFSDRYHTVLYPSEALAGERLNLSSTAGKPFSHEMALVAGEILPPLFFEVPVLDRYRDDPRYDVHFNDYTGRISIGSEYYLADDTPDRDKIVTDGLGLGIANKNGVEIPLVCAFRRYLSRLTPEHQQHWNSFRYVPGNAKMHRNFWKSAIEGEYYQANSATRALLISVQYLREASLEIWGRPILRENFPEALPKQVSSLMAPTQRSLNSFYEELEKILVSNLNKTFFEGLVQLHIEEPRSDGKSVLRAKGTLQLLKDFLISEPVSWTEEVVDSVMKPLRVLRDRRSKSAHNLLEDRYDIDVYNERRRMLAQLVFSFGSLAKLFASHPSAPKPDFPNWFIEEDLEYL